MNSISYLFIAPVYNLDIDGDCRIELSDDEFVQQQNIYLLDEPKALIQSGKRYSIPKLTEAPSQRLPFPKPKTKIRLIANKPEEIDSLIDNGELIDRKELPPKFDSLENLGQIAFRSGSGSGGGFRTITNYSNSRKAETLLVVSLVQAIPPMLANSIGGLTNNPYEYTLTESFLYSLQLFSRNIPQFWKGFHFANGRFTNMISKWPFAEVTGDQLKLEKQDMDRLKHLFRKIWFIHVSANKKIGLSRINLAVEYFYLSSTIANRQTAFLYLMIAFEALFKKSSEKNLSQASNRIAKFLAHSREECRKLNRWAWSTKDNPGFSQLRNSIVHGGGVGIKPETFKRLREMLRICILELSELAVIGQIDCTAYDESIHSYCEKRFQEVVILQ